MTTLPPTFSTLTAKKSLKNIFLNGKMFYIFFSEESKDYEYAISANMRLALSVLVGILIKYTKVLLSLSIFII